MIKTKNKNSLIVLLVVLSTLFGALFCIFSTNKTEQVQTVENTNVSYLYNGWKTKIPSNVTTIEFTNVYPTGYTDSGSVGAKSDNGYDSYTSTEGIDDVRVFINGTNVKIYSPASKLYISQEAFTMSNGFMNKTSLTTVIFGDTVDTTYMLLL